MHDKTTSLLCELISINSINPSLVEGGAGEESISQATADHLRQSGLDVEIAEVAPGRHNVVGVLEGREPGRSLMLCGHLDTVGVEGMTHPFDPIEHDGKLYGRGSGDMKGGLAAMLDAARALAQNVGWQKGRLIVAAVVDEEYTSIGAESLVKNWKADAAIVAEPTGLMIAVGHKGFSWVEVVVEGRAAHGSRPQEGRDAILNMGRVLSKLETLTQRLQAGTPHALLGCPSLHASLISGGREMSTYPDKCVLKLERRNVVGEKPDVAVTQVQQVLDSLSKEDNEFVASARLLFDRPPYETPPELDLTQLLESATVRLGRSTCREGMTYWTDAAILGQAGIPSVIFGPGGAGYHGLDEYVWIDQVSACRDVLTAVARDFCG